jgi:hypothetical protein
MYLARTLQLRTAQDSIQHGVVIRCWGCLCKQIAVVLLLLHFATRHLITMSFVFTEEPNTEYC